MANNKTGKDASGATFTYKTTDNAGVDTPHLNVDTIAIQYTEGDTDATIAGLAMLWEDTSDTLRAVSAANPLPTEIVAGSMSLSNGADPLTTGNDIDVVVSTPTVTNGAYSANDVMGGPLTIANAFGTLKSGILQSIGVFFKGAHTPDLDIYIFDTLPNQTTADNGAFAWHTSDDDNLVWVQHVLTADYITIPGATTRTFAPILPGYPALKSTTTDLFVFVVAVDAVTLTSTSDLRLTFGIARD